MMEYMDTPNLPELVKQYVYTKQSLESDPENVSLQLALAEICVRAGLLRTAVQLLTSIEAKHPDMVQIGKLKEYAGNSLQEMSGKFCVIAADADGTVIILDRIANILTKFSCEGDKVWTVEREGFEDDALFTPDSLAVSRDSVCFVGSSLLRRIQVFDSSGAFVRVFPVPKRIGPTIRIESLACDEDGNVWVMDSESGVLRLYSPSGEEIRSYRVKD